MVKIFELRNKKEWTYKSTFSDCLERGTNIRMYVILATSHIEFVFDMQYDFFLTFAEIYVLSLRKIG